MAEVRRKFGEGVFRLLKNSNNFLFLRAEEKEAKSPLFTVAVSSGTRICRPHYEDAQAHGGCTCSSCESVEMSKDNIEKLPVRETTLLTCLPKQEFNVFCRLGGGFFTLGLNVPDSEGLFLEDSGLSGFDNRLCIFSCCETGAHSGLLKKSNWPGNEDLATTEAKKKYTETPNCFYPSLNYSPQNPVRVFVNKISIRNPRNFLTATILSESHHSGVRQERSFCTVMLTEREPNHCSFLQRCHQEAVSISRVYSKKSSSDPPLYQSTTAYYDILQVSPNATHAQIKTAYYKQSFIYHPDRNSGSEEATQRFSEICEAYNVLGNKGLKWKYDRGILSKTDVHGAGRPSSKEAPSSTASQAKRSHQSPTVGMGEKSVFDFDEFYRAHYGEQLQREKEFRWRREQMRKKQQDGNQDSTSGRMSEITLVLLMAMTVGILVSLKS